MAGSQRARRAFTMWVSAVILALFLAACGRPAQPEAPNPPVTPAAPGNVSPSVASAAGVASLPQIRGGAGEPVPVNAAGSTARAGQTESAAVSGARVPVLMYHEIGDGPNELYVSEKSLAEQLDLLARQGYHSLTLDQLYSVLTGEAPLPPRPVVFTFDDGYASAYSKAFPLLRRHGFTGVFFIYTNGVGAADRVTWDELREMKAAGMEIEAHSASHSDLSLLSRYPRRLQAETAGARATLEAQLGGPVEYFCYPAGRYNATVIQALQGAGYKAALTTKPGWTSSAQSPYEWRRVRINRSDSLAAFTAKLGAALPARQPAAAGNQVNRGS